MIYILKSTLLFKVSNKNHFSNNKIWALIAFNGIGSQKPIKTRKAFKKGFLLKKLLGNDTCFVPNFTPQDFAVMFGKIIKLLL